MKPAEDEAGLYDTRGRCWECGSHKQDHGVGGVCPQRPGPSDMRGYDLGPRR